MTKYPALEARRGEPLFAFSELEKKEERFIEKLVKSKGYESVRRFVLNQASKGMHDLIYEESSSKLNKLQGEVDALLSLIEALDGFLPESSEEQELKTDAIETES